MTESNARKRPKNVLLSDPALCIGCSSCLAACRMEHHLPDGCNTVKVLQLGPFGQDEELAMAFQSTTCFHCERPACVAECPTGAMQKRDDGIVFSDTAICIGCQTCAVACPYGVPVLNEETGKIAKCDGCRDRIDRGLWPACALKCPTDALVYGPSAGVVQDRRQQRALKVAGAI